MATNGKVFVSPGVYTSEVDLSFVAQSVGVTTLGIAGETLKGPAFEPIFIKNYEEFQTYFGGTSAEKFINTQIPKYEAAYIAKSYLQQSNQLFVTRVLGLSGYDAGPSWSIITQANVDPTTIDFYCTTPQIVDCLPYCDPADYKVTPYVVEFTGCSNSQGTISYTTSFPAEIETILTDQFEQFNGDVSTLQTQINNMVFDVLTDATPFTAQTNTIAYFGTIYGPTYDILSPEFTNETNVYGVPSVSSTETNYESPYNDPWYYSLFTNNGNNSYSGFSFFAYVDSLIPIPVTTTTTIPFTPTPTQSVVNPCATATPAS